jgi:hypothetical protein
MTILANDFVSGSLTGTLEVVEGKLLLDLPTVKKAFSGDKSFVVRIRRNSIAGPVVSSTPEIILRDFSEILSITQNKDILSEGDSVLFTINTANVDNNSNIYYSLSGNATIIDFLGNTGVITIVDNVGYANVTANADLSDFFEGEEQFNLQLRFGSNTGQVFATSNVVTIVDTSNAIGIQSVSVSSSNIYESESIILTVNTVNAFGNSAATYYYTVTGNATIFGNTSGSIIVNDNQGFAEIISESDVNTGEIKLLDLQVRETSVSGTIKNNSGNIFVNPFTAGATANSKVSLITTITSNTATISKSQSAVFTVNTQGATNGETLYYDTLAQGNGLVRANTFVSGNTGSFTVTGNTGTITLTANNIADYEDIFRLRVRRNSITGPILGTSNAIIYAGQPSFNSASLVLSAGNVGSNIFETQSVTVNISTLNASNSYTLYYTTTGNADIFGGNSGSIPIVNNSASLELIAESSVPTNERRVFSVQIREGSTTGTILATTGNVIVRDVDTYTPETFTISATGGNVETYSNYKIHIFTVSNSFVVSSLTANAQANIVEYLIVAGGGAGGSSSFGAGGGGAGGVRLSNLALTTTGTYPVTIGAGAASGVGSNSSVFSLVALGGGNGGGSSGAGAAGGSGGGGSNNGGGPGPAIGFPGPTAQGYPGGGPAKGSGINNASAAGGGGAGEAGITPPAPNSGGGRGGHGIEVPWVPATLGSNVAQAYPAPGAGAPGGTRFFAGGGGSGSEQLNIASPGGRGGGGAGNPSLAGNPLALLGGQPAVVNTGGGGGGGGHASGAAGSGGSGIIVIRYPIIISNRFTPRTSYVANVSPNTSSIINNSEIRLDANLVNSANGVVLYYSTIAVGNAVLNSNAFVSGNTGSFTVNGNVGSFVMTRSNEPFNGSFRVQIRRNSNTGPILGNTSAISVVSTNAQGGNLFIQGSNVFHVFTSTGNLVVTSNIQANILMVAGGGAGGQGGTPSVTGGGGGGGAGGLVWTPLQTISSGTYLVTIGAGGTAQSRGANTEAFGLLAMGGGGGAAISGPSTTPGSASYNGGSGAGAGWVSFGTANQIVAGGSGLQTTSPAIPATSKTFGYGNAGGQGRDNTSVNGGGGGAGGAGANYTAGTAGVGLGVPWVPAAYGQTGPVANVRYFSYGGGSATNTAGLASTGQGGGGGTAGNATPYAGGSGIVIVRYTL